MADESDVDIKENKFSLSPAEDYDPLQDER